MRMSTVAALAVAVYFGLRLLVPSWSQSNDSTDYHRYYEPVARNVVAGRGLMFNGSLATEYPPGYPLLLAGVFAVSERMPAGEPWLLTVFGGVCFAVSAVCLERCGWLVWGSRGGLLCAVLWITFPPMLWLTKQPNSELPYVGLLYASVALLLPVAMGRPSRGRVAFMAGLLAGLASLIRPAGILNGATLAAAVLVSPIVCSAAVRRWKVAVSHAVLVLAGNAAALAPWEVFVWSRTGDVIPLSTSGPAAVRLGLTFAVTDRGDHRELVSVPSAAREVMQAAMAAEQAGGLRTEAAVRSFLADEWSRHPWSVVQLYLWKAGRAWYATDSGRHERPILWLHLAYLIVIAVGIAGCLRSAGTRALVVIVFAVTVQTWVLVTATFSIARYMTPTMGLLLLLVPGVGQQVRLGRKCSD